MPRKPLSLRAMVEALAAEAENYAQARARSAASLARNGMANVRMMAAEDKALTRFEAARDALLAALCE
jgi:hypothetical protein